MGSRLRPLIIVSFHLESSDNRPGSACSFIPMRPAKAVDFHLRCLSTRLSSLQAALAFLHEQHVKPPKPSDAIPRVYIHVYMCIYIYIYVYLSTYIHAYTYIHIYIYTCMYIHICIHVYIYILVVKHEYLFQKGPAKAHRL